MSDELKRVGLVFTEEGAEKFTRTLKEVNSEIGKNYLEFKKTQAQWDSTTSSTEKLEFQIKNLGQAIELNKEKADALKIAIRDLENAEETDTKAKEKNQKQLEKKRKELEKTELKIISFTKKVESMTQELNNSGKKIEETGKKIEKIGNSVEKAGGKMSAFSVATGTALLASAKSAIDFEDAFTGVEKTIDGTEEQMQTLKQGIRDMAKEIPSTTTEISAVAEAAGQLGIKTEDILSFTKVMIDLGNSTNLSAEEAASSLAKFANITNMTAKDYDRLGATIVALGNNFATTEADIVEMATRLAATGDLAGLSQAQILALATAMSSVGIEAEAGGSAMSKLLKQIQVAVETGSDDLKDFAQIAGMSIQDFKNAFEKDGVSALSAFIGGLNDTERNGKSAIAILEDMGLTEVRLSNTILSLANSNGLMNQAIELGNEAWEDNTALTNEANKRYNTLKSELIIALNKIKDLAITIGNKLMPQIRSATEIIEKLTNWFSQLTDEEVETIVKTGTLISVIAPLVTTIGKLISLVGGGVTVLGTFSQALQVVQGKATTTDKGVKGLATAISGITSPLGVATIALAGFATGISLLKNKVEEELQATTQLINEIQNATKTREDSLLAIESQRDATLAEISNTERLKNELASLVDENGKVKEGYESRVEFILGELNQSLGTEYELNNNIIDSYKEMQTSIDELIQKKKAQIILEANEEKYKEAIQNKTKAYEDQIKAMDELANVENEIKQIYKDQQSLSIIKENSMIEAIIKVNELKEKQEELNTTIKNQDAQLKEYNDSILMYESNSQLMLEGGVENYKKIEQSIATTTSNITLKTNEELGKQIEAQILANQEAQKLYALETQYNKNAKDSIYATNVVEGEKQLALLASQLVAMTTTTEENSPQVIEAWKQLSTNSYSTYYDTISNLPPELKNKIEEMTGVVAEKTPELEQETQNMAQNVVDKVKNSDEFKNEALKNMNAYLSGLEDEELRRFLEAAGVEDVDRVIKGIRDGNLAEDEGIKILDSLNSGLQSRTWKDKLFTTARNIASTISGLLTIKANVNGKTSALPGHKLGLDYVPKDNYVARLHKGERVLTAEENKAYSAGEDNARSQSTNYMSSAAISSKIDYNKMASAMLKALTGCKFTLDEDGFARIVKEELYKVV